MLLLCSCLNYHCVETCEFESHIFSEISMLKNMNLISADFEMNMIVKINDPYLAMGTNLGFNLMYWNVRSVDW